ncbi:tetratricopeptide repeat protein [Azospira restricta]|uniref:Tetratricopeptide repeat protein n=1 Tax=Azospira restricta TaxID=404405 RepID=A0A974SQ37_9RHOO|nr:tetratricopeptide repeat protein [Azospira restricta]QRJ64318.1 tetratricopeptide repeat protein [Azospira restricta]
MRGPVAGAAALLLATLVGSATAATAAATAFADLAAPLEIVVDRDPSRVAAAKRLARLHAETRDWAAAWRVLERSLAHAGRDAEYQGFAGTVLRQLKRPTDAAAAYRRAVTLQPDDGRWWLGLALALDDAGRKTEARQAFAAAGERRETLPPVLQKLAERRGR